MKNKRAWIRIVEASVAVVFLAGVLLLVLHQQSTSGNGNSISSDIHEIQIGILRNIQTNESLRSDVLNVDMSGGQVGWSDSGFPSELKNHIEDLSPGALTCKTSICGVSGECILGEQVGNDVYSESVFISVTPTQNPNTMPYSPKLLKLFCWKN